MKRLPMDVKATPFARWHDAAVVRDGDAELGDAVADTILDTISTDVEVTIGGVTMHLAAWRDPDHWSSDWATLLGCDYDDASERVWSILSGAVVDT